jgi:RNA polymerase sigma-70 factor (ECF subfamily)
MDGGFADGLTAVFLAACANRIAMVGNRSMAAGRPAAPRLRCIVNVFPEIVREIPNVLNLYLGSRGLVSQKPSSPIHTERCLRFMNFNGELDSIYERLLVIRAQGRDHAAFHELVVRYERRLLYYIRRLLGNEEGSVDVLQEVWLLVFRKLSTLRAPEAFRVWIYKLAHDQAVTHIKARSNWPAAAEIEHAAASDIESWNEMELLENAEMVHRALDRLSQIHREVLTLRFLEGLELTEIAEIVGCGVGTVKSRLHYAKSALRRILAGEYHD